jgi:hypothetical protein
MTPDAVPPDAADGRTRRPVSEATVQRLADAVARLANDPDYFIQALTDLLLAMKPISLARLSENEARFLIESGSFTAEEWAVTSASVTRGALQLSATEGWLLALFATKSMEDVAGFLDWSEEDVRSAVADGSLYAVKISGRLRFPTWQLGSPGRLLPGLPELIAVISPRWNWQSAAGFMATRQSKLVAEGRKTPVEWLRDGGDVNAVKEIVEASDWS